MKIAILLFGIFINASLFAQDTGEMIWDYRNMIGIPAPTSSDDWTFVSEEDDSLNFLKFKLNNTLNCEAHLTFSVWSSFGSPDTKEEIINAVEKNYKNYTKTSKEDIVINDVKGISQRGTFESYNEGDKMASVISVVGSKNKPIYITLKISNNETCYKTVYESYKEFLKGVTIIGSADELKELKSKVEEKDLRYYNRIDAENLILLAEKDEDWALKKGIGLSIYHLYDKHDNKEAAKKWLTKQADYGTADAQFWLGMEYGDWKGYSNSNYRTLQLPVNMDLHKSYLEKAYINDNKRASGLLIRTYEKEKDYKNLIKWLKLDVLQGETGARRSNYELYKIYFEGEKAPKDYNKANSYLRKAVKVGDENANFLYGVKLYEGKEGIDQNKIKGLDYLKKASNWGVCSAYEYLVSKGIYVEDKGDCDENN
ncbi:tetratricopeptide repeat protein [Marixanthomonas ophiurae]|uniref:Sel1 repeat family protein n=1 Tax=Marixanthomonas ophiurae TaxID=387659 RepID=A0A3E1Q7S0_9FLAO|nr:sel1 repeat family protein [Marixanthomonas ophiurae]RFN58176.1 sel1 repeat family protein [Marixanthomonas ophiurae]